MSQPDTNRVTLTGILTHIDSGKTSQDFLFSNIVVTSKGLKYTENVPCVIYGETARMFLETVKLDDSVLVEGRLRIKTSPDPKTKQERSFISVVVSRIKKVS